jgi:hypothetical protein
VNWRNLIDLIDVLGLVGLAWFGLDFKCLGGALGSVCGVAHFLVICIMWFGFALFIN